MLEIDKKKLINFVYSYEQSKIDRNELNNHGKAVVFHKRDLKLKENLRISLIDQIG